MPDKSKIVETDRSLYDFRYEENSENYHREKSGITREIVENISKEKEYLTKPLQEMMDTVTYGGKFNPRVIVKTASLQNDAGILGAAALVLKD